jgi:hypothetical protein
LNYLKQPLGRRQRCIFIMRFPISRSVFPAGQSRTALKSSAHLFDKLGAFLFFIRVVKRSA